MRLRNLDVIIPTWNSLPEFQCTLDTLIRAFGSSLHTVIIVDKHSHDGTIDVAVDWGKKNNIAVKIVWDSGTLGSARKTGLQAASTKWVAFVDSDIYLPKGWLTMITKFISTGVGWVYGYTKEDCCWVEAAHEYKRQLRNNFPRTLKIGEFERAYTNNTICLRKPLLDAPIEELNAWEDYVMGQHMIQKGYDVLEVEVACIHLKTDVYAKFGFYTEAWGIAGELKAKGINPYTLMRPFYFLYWGVRCTIHFKDFAYLKHYTGVFLSMINALRNTSKCFAWSRD